MVESTVKIHHTSKKQIKVCPECGQPVEEHTESQLMECDHCLSKKEE